MRLRPLLLAVLLPIGIACDAPTEPLTPAAYVAVSRVQYSATLQPYAVGAAGGTVHVDGHIITADPCHGFAASATRGIGRLTVTLHARPNSTGCLQPAGEWNYRLSVPEVPSGSWRVTLRHSFAPGTVAETVLDSIVVVPAAR